MTKRRFRKINSLLDKVSDAYKDLLKKNRIY